MWKACRHSVAVCVNVRVCSVSACVCPDPECLGTLDAFTSVRHVPGCFEPFAVVSAYTCASACVCFCVLWVYLVSFSMRVCVCALCDCWSLCLSYYACVWPHVWVPRVPLYPGSVCGVSVVSLCRVSLPVCSDDVRVCDDSVHLSFSCVSAVHVFTPPSASLLLGAFACLPTCACVTLSLEVNGGGGSTVRVVTGQARPGCPAPAPSHPLSG